MIKGQCRFCTDYLLLNDKLECIDSIDDETPNGRGQCFRITNKEGEGRTYIICPECASLVTNICIIVSEKVTNNLISKYDQIKEHQKMEESIIKKDTKSKTKKSKDSK